jgi:C1A family cysteine protease
MKKLVISILLFSILFSNFVYSQFDTSYDLRPLNLVTPVKDQGLTCGACWSFASCAAIESSWLKQSYGTYDLSEDNLTDCHNFDPGPCEWGNFYMTNALLSAHRGILTETQDPYTTSLTDCPFSMTFPPIPAAYVEEMRIIPGNINDIKQALLDYGAVASSMFFNGISANYDAINYKYYDPIIGSEDEPYAHCVTIVGWDDNLTFTGAPNNGGWIIKDSYGTSWANSGYFYCSYYDAGILSSNVVFPTKVDIPPENNDPHVYYYDEFGWVNNFGYSTNQAYALIKYTILPENGDVSGQQIKRIGTYAVTENSTIEVELYRTKTSNVLSDFITSSNVNCDEAGFYTLPLSLKTDSIGSTIYIKIKYTCDAGSNQPIPIEEYEEYSSSAFSATTGLCWISNDGSNWTQVGVGTSNSFDLCIKMYTENAPTAIMSNLPESICQGEHVILNCETMSFDSLKWFANDVFIIDIPNLPYMTAETGTITIDLVVWQGHNSDTISHDILVYELPEQPSITMPDENMLESSEALAYQWYTDGMIEIPGETNQIYFPPIVNDSYIVRVFNEWGCYSDSEPYYFIADKIKKESEIGFSIFPNPAKNIVSINFECNTNTMKQIKIFDSLGKIVYETETSKSYLQIDLQEFASGKYNIQIDNKTAIQIETFIKY